MPTKRKVVPETMSKAELGCWASGGVWVDGKCEPVINLISRVARGVGCDPTEAAIRRILPDPIRTARDVAMKPLDDLRKTNR